MKKIKLLSVAFLFIASFTACQEDSDALTGNNNTGGLISVNSKAVGYVVGNGLTTPYDLNISIDQAPVRTTKIDVYKTFTDKFGNVSNEVFYKSIDLSSSALHESVDFEVNFNELRTDLIVNGSPIPTDDTLLNIGDSWSLRYVSTLSNGQVHQSAELTKISVGTRFSGIYRCVDGAYYRIGVLTYTAGDWPDETIIEAVDASTYRVKKYFGPFTNTSTATGGDYYFTINSSDVIEYPATTPTGVPQSGNLQPFITCTSNPSDMTNVNCGSSNYVLRDNVNGKDKLYMSFGYLAPNGSREFYQVMEKL